MQPDEKLMREWIPPSLKCLKDKLFLVDKLTRLEIGLQLRLGFRIFAASTGRGGFFSHFWNDGLLVDGGADNHKLINDVLPLLFQQTALPQLRPKKRVVIEWIIHNGEAEPLKVHADLVGAPSVRLAQDNGGAAIVREPLEPRLALLAFCPNHVKPKLKRGRVEGLVTDNLLLGLWELTDNSCDIFLLDVTLDHLLLQLLGLSLVL